RQTRYLPPLYSRARGVKYHCATPLLHGLIVNCGVHALDQHLLASIALAHRHDVPVAVHAWLDGRDTPPQSALGFMQELLEGIEDRGSGMGGRGGRAPPPPPPAPPPPPPPRRPPA